MKIKKILKHITLLSLTVGASLIVGFLCFSGMFALWPILSLATAGFTLAVAFESEVYYQNIKHALRKLFKADHVTEQLGKEYLRQYFLQERTALEYYKESVAIHTELEALYLRNDESEEDTSQIQSLVQKQKDTERALAETPQFFEDYQATLIAMDALSHTLDLTLAQEARQVALAKELKDMEKWFAWQLFNLHQPTTQPSRYQQQLQAWLAKHDQAKYQQRRVELQQAQQPWFYLAGISSLIASIGMSFATSYLLLDAVANIPLLASISITWLPIIILPLALIAGTAYGCMTYSALHDMITQRTLEKWANKLTDYLTKQDWTINTAPIAIFEITLLALIISLTFCTAGTWRTIATQTPPLFAWMKQLPSVIMGWINPIILSLTTLIFNLQNTSETLDIVDMANRFAIRPLQRLPQDRNSKIPSAFYNSYLYIQGDAQNPHKLYYISAEGVQSDPIDISDQNAWQKHDASLAKQETVYLTLDEIKQMSGHTPSSHMLSSWLNAIHQDYQAWCAIDNTWQRWNPFRLLIYFTFNPLKDSLFTGHLASSAATADQVAGIPRVVSAGVAAACDAAVDVHYFIPRQPQIHDHSVKSLVNERLGEHAAHDHHNDIPTFMLKCIFYPLHLAADAWDHYSAADDQASAFSFRRTWKKLLLVEPIPEMAAQGCVETDCIIDHQLSSDTFGRFSGACKDPKLAHAWPIEHAVYRIEKFKDKQLHAAWFSPETARTKMEKLSELQQDLQKSLNSKKKPAEVAATIEKTVKRHHQKNTATYQQQRHGLFWGKTATDSFLEEELCQRLRQRC